MGKKKGRPRKRMAEKEVHREEEGEGDSCNVSPAADQQSPNVTPPLQGNFSATMNHQSATPRYPTRKAKKVVGQYANYTTTPLRYPVRSSRRIPRRCSTFKHARKVLAEISDETSQATNDDPISEEFAEEPPLQTQVSSSPASSSGTPRLAKKTKTTENLNSICEESQEPNLIPLTTNDLELEKFAPKLILLTHGPEKSANKGNQKDDHPERSLSLNLTEIAAMLGVDSSDEVESSVPELALVTVNGYRVKPEFATILRAIFAKHGDIAKDSSFKSTKSRSSLLEMICGIFQKLQNTEFTHITSVELKSMIDIVGDLESVRLELGWLLHRLFEISEAVEMFQGSSALKEAKSRNTEAIKLKEKDLEDCKAEMVMLQQKLWVVEDELVMMRAETDKINRSVSETKAKLKCFCGRSLVDGLF